MKTERYVYYQVAVERADALRAAAMAVQAALRRQHPELHTRLLSAPDAAAASRQTWMEVYAAPSCTDGVGDALLNEIETLARQQLAPLIAGERHIESFVPCA